jgi:hypothetical protein
VYRFASISSIPSTMGKSLNNSTARFNFYACHPRVMLVGTR